MAEAYRPDPPSAAGVNFFLTVLYSAFCTARSRTAKVDVDMTEEGAVQRPSGAPVAVVVSQVKDFFKLNHSYVNYQNK